MLLLQIPFKNTIRYKWIFWVRNLILKFFLVFTIFWDHQIKGIDFTLGDGNTEVYFACSLVFKGETLILGGKRNYNQVSFRWQWCWWLNDGEILRCWWQYVGDFFHCWSFLQYTKLVTNIPTQSPRSKNCHQHKWSPTSHCHHRCIRAFSFLWSFLFFDRSVKWNLVDWNEMKKIYHSTRIYMHKSIVAFIISNVASIKNPPKLHSFVAINNVSRECLFVTDSYICHHNQ